MDSLVSFPQLPSEAELLVVSDVHIRSSDDPRYHLLLQLIQDALQKNIKNVLLNGDIFDFYFGWGPFFYKKYETLFRQLDLLVDQGCHVFYTVGNHEFGVEPLRKKHRFEIITEKTRKLLLRSKKTLLITHGDLLLDDPMYQLFRAIIRSPLANLLGSLVPQTILDKFTLWFASKSRQRDPYRVLNHERIKNAAEQLLVNTNSDDLIMGHFHFPYEERFPLGQRLLSVESWDRPNCLVLLKDGTVQRFYAESSNN